MDDDDRVVKDTVVSTAASSSAAGGAAAAAGAAVAPLASFGGVGLISLSDEEISQIKVFQQDPTSPLHAVKSFEELNLPADILKGIYELRYERPSSIQEKALPLIMRNPPENLIAQSQNGTGKTLAFSLGMVVRVERALKEPQGLCLAPTRELARQTADCLSAIAKYTDISVRALLKDSVPAGTQVRDQLLVGTPGTVMSLIKSNQLSLRSLKVFVLDEADNMLEAKAHTSDSTSVKKFLPKACQVCLFSATYPERVEAFARKIVGDQVNKLLLPVRNLAVKTIRQYYIECSDRNVRMQDFNEAKFKVLDDLYSLLTIGQCIIFVGTRAMADKLKERLTQNAHTVSCIHGGEMAPAERDRVMNDFRMNKTRILISTDLLARGIDVLHVTLVINYDLPYTFQSSNDGRSRDTFRPDYATYLHRVGRTGRFGKKGMAVNLVSGPADKKFVDMTSSHFEIEIKKLDAPTDANASELEKIFAQ